jgi:hypothetical protein
MENVPSDKPAAKPFLSKRALIILSTVALVSVVGAVVAAAVLSNKPTQSSANQDNQQTQPTPQPTAELAPGQTNPNVVGFGQTFECNPRSDEEFHRTDGTLVIDPKNPDVMYVNAEYLGFHKTTDGGKTWTLLTNGIKAYGRNDDPNTPCYAEYPFAVIDPTNSQRVILVVSGAGGTPKDLNALPSGILESTDGGASFHQLIDDDMNGYVSSFTLDPSDPSVVYYGTNSSPASYLEADPNNIFVDVGLVYKLEDGKWTELPTGFLPYTGGSGIHVNPENPDELVLFTFTAPKPQGGVRDFSSTEQMGILRSTDGGNTWTETHPFPVGYEAILLHDVAPTNFQHMFATPYAATGGPKSFYSVDGGKTFQESGHFIDFMKYDPHDPSGNRLLGYNWQSMMGPAVNKLFESTDAGATWHEFANLPVEIESIGAKKTLISNIVWHPTDPDTFFMSGASALVWKTTDNGQTWTKLLDYTML